MNSIADAMRSGLYYGFASLVDGILERLVEEIEGLEVIVATGGRAALIADASENTGTPEDESRSDESVLRDCRRSRRPLAVG